STQNRKIIHKQIQNKKMPRRGRKVFYLIKLANYVGVSSSSFWFRVLLLSLLHNFEMALCHKTVSY
ncbi:hypothetical protein MQA28_25775, partial [Escherichia coli]|nr:hypothetical protein [Escherichia coli]